MHNHSPQEWNEQILAQIHAFTLLNKSVFTDREEASGEQDFKLHDQHGLGENR